MTLNSGTSVEPALAFGPFRLLLTQRILLRGTERLRLGNRALELLLILTEQAGQVVKKRALTERAWPGTFVEEGTLRVQIAALRKVLNERKSATRYIENVTGHGYRFVATVTRLLYREKSPIASDQITEISRPSAVPPRLIGRAPIVASLAARLTKRGLTTIVGPGGVGKTAVALATVEHLRQRSPQGICFVDLGSTTEPHLVLGAIAIALGLTPVSPDPMADIAQFLKHGHTLLVLDSCEHILDVAAQLIEALLRDAPDTHILATSREPLRAKDEVVFRLSPLELPPPATRLCAHEALRFTAIQLFSELATFALHRAALDDADIPFVVDICTRLDGLPLAIELAVLQLDVFGIRGLALCLDDGLGFLTKGHRTALPRHKTLRATLDWSYLRLSPIEQTALCRLAIFTDTFDGESANSVIGDEAQGAAETLAILTDLAAKSLLVVQVDDDQVVYRLLNTTKAYALEKLSTSLESLHLARGRTLSEARTALHLCIGSLEPPELPCLLAAAS
jgi:predicted ATPase/DNA-binding winged helix-turn-helix (wHTH) protein